MSAANGRFLSQFDRLGRPWARGCNGCGRLLELAELKDPRTDLFQSRESARASVQESCPGRLDRLEFKLMPPVSLALQRSDTLDGAQRPAQPDGGLHVPATELSDYGTRLIWDVFGGQPSTNGEVDSVPVARQGGPVWIETCGAWGSMTRRGICEPRLSPWIQTRKRRPCIP